jgi:5'-3' exonuclease
LIDVKALMGDTSDNYPGVKGIGEKTAYKLIQKYKTIDGLLGNLDELTKGQQTKITECIEDLHLSRQLAEIKCDVPVACILSDAKFHLLFDEALAMLSDHQIKGIEPFLFKLERYREIS